MGKMALGFGSEFHLLRWMGRHRNGFDNHIKNLLQVDNISWLDFEFDAGAMIPDKELIGLSFLGRDSQFDNVISKWRDEWPQRGNSMNWDLVGYTENSNERTWIFIEAKAHLGELEQSSNASNESLKKINKALTKAAENNGINMIDKNPWTKKYYQLANRIYILDLLKRCSIKAKLINIYFIGDLNSRSRKSPQDKETWQSKIDEMKEYLNIKDNKSFEVLDLFLDVDKL
jgi:hypothetical protein